MIKEEELQYFILDSIPCVGVREDEYSGDIYKIKDEILENQRIVERLKEWVNTKTPREEWYKFTIFYDELQSILKGDKE